MPRGEDRQLARRTSEADAERGGEDSELREASSA
jgi:hypothetical protein